MSWEPLGGPPSTRNQVSDASGSMKIEEAGVAPLRKDMLNSSDAFVLDTAQQLFVWIGKKATKEEKNKAWDVANVRGDAGVDCLRCAPRSRRGADALALPASPGDCGRCGCAQAFIKDKGYPMATPVTRLNDGAETSIFIQQFDVWPQPQLSPNFAPKRGNVAKVEQGKVDYKALYGGKREAQAMVDDGKGKLEVCRCSCRCASPCPPPPPRPPRRAASP